MRIRAGTYIARTTCRRGLGLALLAVAALAVLSGCGGGGGSTTARAPDGPLTVYLSVPAHGVEASAAGAVSAGARLALGDAHGRAGDRDVRIMRLDDSKPGGSTWDPATVEANAKLAAKDPTAIAYIGELDQGGSAISVPVTNDAGILQVSPLDGLTTLTHQQPGAVQGTGPARYYPSGTRTFLRLVPRDALQATALIGWARDQGGQRVAIVQDQEVFGRTLAEQVATAAERARMPVTDLAEAHDDPTTFDDFARKLAAKRPDVVVYTGLGSATAGRLLQAIGRALPGAKLIGSSALADAVPTPPGLPETDVLSPLLPASAYGPRARRVLGRISPRPRGATGAEALYGYEAMRVVIDSIAATGADAGDRAAVARAALAPRRRASVIGPYRVLATGDLSPVRFGAYVRSGAGLRYLGERRPQR
jgi:branched-chain amino acid transport system substrate-binding protein